MALYSFPENFLFGSATSALQVEGSLLADGAGETVWGELSKKRRGYIEDGADFNRACDQYRMFREDAALMKELGIQAYRFSINWARIFPDGDGQPNRKGLDYYSALTDCLLENGIQPFATLYHWDLPQSLETRFGGWRSKHTSEAFGVYAEQVAAALGDRIKNYFTLNEIECFTNGAYNTDRDGGYMAPAVRCSRKEELQTVHNALLAHGLAVQALRAGVRGVSVGLAENSRIYIPAIETEANIAAAKTLFRRACDDKLAAICEGRYSDAYLTACGANAPDFNDAEMRLIGAPLDFIGLNIYAGGYAVADANGEARELPWPEKYPSMEMDWEKFTPDALYWGMRIVSELWHPEKLYITESGCAVTDRIDPVSGQVCDTDRVMFLREYLKGVCRALSEGIPARGYFAWSLLDNLEWRHGRSKKFGLIEVDPDTMERHPKLSAEFYAETIRRRTLA